MLLDIIDLIEEKEDEEDIDKMMQFIIENHSNPRSRDFANGVMRFKNSGLQLSIGQIVSIKNTYNAMSK